MHPVYRRKLPKTDGKRGGEAGEKSPNEPSYYEKDASYSFRSTTAPKSLVVLITLVIFLVLGLVSGFFKELPVLLVLMIFGIIISGIFVARYLYNEYWDGDGFLESIKNKVYDPEEQRDKWE